MTSESDAECASIMPVFSICFITMFPRERGMFLSPGKFITDVHQWKSHVWMMVYLFLKLIL